MNVRVRQSNIELLRIFAIIGVIILHYNNKDIGGGFNFVQKYGFNYYTLMVLESINICAVNLFMLISGYFSCNNKKTKFQKPFKLLLQTILFSLSWNVLSCILNRKLSIESIIVGIIPSNYFIILYIVVYIVSPYLNVLRDKVDTKFITIVFLLFSVEPTVVDVFTQITNKEWLGLSNIGMYGSQWGYQIINFILMYYIGMYLKDNIDHHILKQSKLIYKLIGVISLITLWSCISDSLGLSRNIAWSYCNPLVIIESILIFLIFNKINIGTIKWINRLSSASLTIYLFHGYLISHVKISWAVSQNVIILLIHIILSAFVIYLLGFIVHLIFEYIYSIVFGKFEKKNILLTEVK